MNDKLVGKVSEYIDAVATKLGVAAEHVYGLLVRQQVTEGVVNIVSGLVILAVLITLIVFTARKIGSKLDFGYMDGADLAMLLIFGGIGVALIGGCLYFGLSVTTDGIKHLMNPEYYAIKEIIKAVK